MDHLNHPLRFRPLFRRYLWGGRRLGDVFGKNIGPENDYAESWEIVDHGPDQSIVEFGPLRGTSLNDLVKSHAQDFFGHPARWDRFPLLFKLLDATKLLSVQVHPNDEQAKLLEPPDFGKTEAWVILAADEGAFLYGGLRPGISREQFAAKVADGTCEDCLERIEPRVGDCFFLPAGVVHALGPGLMVAEIQQSSDTTYRLYDWNRLGPDGKQRALHLTAGLAAIDYSAGPCRVQVPVVDDTGAETLVDCDKFRLCRRRVSNDIAWSAKEGMRLVVVLDGALELADDPAGRPLIAGEVALLPAALFAPRGRAASAATLLEVTLP